MKERQSWESVGELGEIIGGKLGDILGGIVGEMM